MLALLLTSTPVAASDLHVFQGQSIQAAIDMAVHGDRVLVHAGTYVETIRFDGKAIEVIGLSGPLATVIDGNGAAPVVAFHAGEGPETRLQGFTVRGGNLLGFGLGAGVSCWALEQKASPLIQDCIITENSNGSYPGGGVAGDPTLERCVITKNRSYDFFGGGVFGAPVMRSCLLAENTATYGGAGLFVTDGAAVVEDCVFVANVAAYDAFGGAIYAGAGSSVSLLRCVLAENEVQACAPACGPPAEGGALYVEGGAIATLDRCTVVDNVALNPGEVGGISSHGTVVVINSIVRGNSFSQISGPSLVSYSDVEGGFAGTGVIDLPPDFVDPANRDYHLQPGSPCIDAGAPHVSDPDGHRVDMGAHYYQSFYTRDNSLPADWQAPGWPRISTTVGGVHRMAVDAGATHAGDTYLVLGSASGTYPGFSYGGFTIPLNPDWYFGLTLSLPGAGLLAGSTGVLDAYGRASCEIAVPAGVYPYLSGLKLHHAFGVLDATTAGLTFVSNVVATEFAP